MINLPPEVIHHIIDYLSDQDYGSLMNTHRNFHVLNEKEKKYRSKITIKNIEEPFLAIINGFDEIEEIYSIFYGYAMCKNYP